MAHRDYEEFFELLNANGVKFLIVGAHAAADFARYSIRNPAILFLKTKRLSLDRNLFPGGLKDERSSLHILSTLDRDFSEPKLFF